MTSIVWSEFKEQAILFLQQSEALGDGWLWTQDRPGFSYLEKRHVPHHSTSSHLSPTSDEEIQNIGEIIEQKDQEEDKAVIQFTPGGDLNFCDYHIVYSTTYQQPVLYFNIHKPDGKQLSHNEILANLNLHIPAGSTQPYISQKEHPALGIPFYHIHPCETAKLMAEVLSQSAEHQVDVQKKNYLLSWLTIVAPVVGLHVPLLYYTQIKPPQLT